ncbi:fumarylacetoacetate hydrolase family protein [Bradyrhizobium sp. U87765 SZCCT0131]|uniref:fumarylacetoacetate hydrolase family protein n=1 Tax=unclassified Bradyrhizobium TaxID=2631580 RepID=UPI001BADB7E9|nr:MULTISPECIES: fumarylacetoacetate hydrolase family protein [unclassified Bradyrhizobium]MBR1218826.1 fumarylacetoacetate hydrolase family protein [Bradyrhizobium sp. U87765 SZCCT0131]MBR1261477.1 fumarylacetoacetate hydrolase family protein [Bradyrhizobium sp. U87765 SZCCT0134]MBR1306670.1 fumarylacetoacetate hydrolase family protein [Bradyrhizobium sp. U87765 SZCCT0110]MBR1317259.1 fumarylacetoacetate hydrolase family protein [Bradyrhizobium sp. U87765 SZCCT0109]MBR1350961.1 fumarylacetoac
MKLLSFTAEGRTSYGAVKDGGVVDLGRRLKPRTLRELLETGGIAEAAAALQGAAADFALDAITYAPVIPDPAKIICVGLNYRDHVAEVGRTVTEKPALFARFATSQVGHLQPVIRPRVSEHFDYEGELALVIGRAGRHIRRKDALAHVAGYACYNEGSVRDWQRHTTQFLAGKTFDRSGAFGPWLVTADEISDPSKLKLETRLNGQTVQSTTTDMMITDVPDLIAYCSTVMTLLPGDVIVTGTPGGVGMKRTPPLFMKPGDTVEVEISGVGLLRNPVAAEE